MIPRTITAAILLLASPAMPPEEPPPLHGHVRVVDGDSLQMGGLRIRLAGIDSPELTQLCRWWSGHVTWRCGEEAKRELEGRVHDEPVTCTPTPESPDRYGRVLAICIAANGDDLGEQMVLAGWALAYRKYSTRYVEQEMMARLAGKGIWTSHFEAPWEWRRSHPRGGR
jgi:endonuclease YncB( thermonuclease family)